MISEDFKLKIEDIAPGFTLPGVDGKSYSLDSFKKAFLAIIWTCNHCPFAIAYEKKLIALAKDFSNADFAAVNSNDAVNYPDDSFERMKERAAEKDFPYPYLHDEFQKAARAYGALVTPHIFVFDKDRKLIYQGGVDDSFSSGDYRNEEPAKEHYLKDALTQISNGEEIKRKTVPVAGCSIKWKSG